VPLEQRIEALVDVLLAEPMSVWKRAELVAAALWPKPAPIPEPPPLRVEWRRRGKTSSPADRAELVRLRDAGWTVGAIADASGWSVSQVKRWTRRTARPE
jgi:hypothetical protein